MEDLFELPVVGALASAVDETILGAAAAFDFLPIVGRLGSFMGVGYCDFEQSRWSAMDTAYQLLSVSKVVL